MAVPLSEYEQRVLREMEEQLASDDPALASQLGQIPQPRRGRFSIICALLLLAGLIALVVGMVLGQIWLSLLGFAAMFAGVWRALATPKRSAGLAGGGKNSSASKRPGPSARARRIADGLEERWDERHGHSR
ncbi:MAG: DUF3040 domain-containing protein [Bifidobacteriaceae bacterium]|nr:DUF3040 domain-containing protein [Bifidobacteriaceae bacterium]